MSYISEVAIITHKGILLQGRYYFNIIALRRRWFELAKAYGEWNLRIYYYPDDNFNIFFIDEETGERQVCTLIKQCDNTNDKLNRYFQSIVNKKCI